MKKTMKLFLLFIVALIGFISLTNVEAATSAPSTITMGSGTQLSGYVGGTYFVKKVTTDGKYVYCTDITKKTPPANMKMTLYGTAQDAGIAYVINNGYPNKSFTGNSNYDYYITQTALWWYLDETTGSSNISSSFKTGSDPYGLRTYIKKLYQAAVSAKSTGYTTPSVSLSASSTSLTLSSDGKYYYSDYITVKGTSITGNITLSVSGGPSGTVLVDESGTAKTSFSSGSKFRIRVTASNVTNLSYSLTVSAAATGSVNKAYLYKPTSSTYQSVIVGVTYPETSTVKATKTFSLKSTQVTITKKATETNTALAGAKMQLTNSSGTVVASWTSTTSGYTIKNLPAGTYTLSEVSAPSGYTLSEEKQEVVLKAGTAVTATFYNTKKEPTKVVIIKRDKDTNATLAGAVFVLKDANGEEVTTWTSTTNGHYVSGLPEGEYTIEELNAPSGYIKSDEVKTVTLESGKTVTVTFYNEKEEIKVDSVLKIAKVNGETGERLAGATLVLKDATGQVVATWTTTEDDYVIEGLSVGTYYLSETKAPDGFVLSTDVIEIEITEDGGTVIATFYNTPEIEVPNTGSSRSIIAIIAGIIALGIGGRIVYINFKKEEA